ncbi:hypothetical protein ABMB67_001085 [Halalkalibacter oceani]
MNDKTEAAEKVKIVLFQQLHDNQGCFRRENSF